jgi:cytochrome c oxidase subunit 2
MSRPSALLVLSSLSVLLVIGLAPETRAQDAKRGSELFHLCQQCHGAHGQGNHMALAPSIAGLESWYVEAQLHKFRDGSRASHFDDLGGMRMRGMARWLKSDEDVKAIAAYVAALPPARSAPSVEGGDAAKGAALYATCSGCHGLKGEGVQAVGGSSLTHTSDWYLLTQLKNFKQGIRGADPRDVTGTAMRGMSMLLVDEQAIKDVLAYISTLEPAAAQTAQGGE